MPRESSSKTLLDHLADLDRGGPPAAAPPRRRRSAPPARHPVTVSRLPVVRCGVCGRPMAHQPGQAAAVLTAHYQQAGHAG